MFRRMDAPGIMKVPASAERVVRKSVRLLEPDLFVLIHRWVCMYMLRRMSYRQVRDRARTVGAVPCVWRGRRQFVKA